MSLDAVIQVMKDTLTKLTSTGRVLRNGELMRLTDTDRLVYGDGTTAGHQRPQTLDTYHEAYIARLDGKYAGVNLTTKHAAEIANYASVWAWLKARTQAGNFEGIHVGDYIPIALSAGTISDGETSYTISAKTLNAQIVGIDTYYGYGDTPVGHHIDFITTNCIGTNIPFNKSNKNNGTATYQNPFMASKIYACLNGINNESTGYNSVAYGYNASSCGVLQLLPQALQDVIITKRVFAPKRYSATAELTEANGREWESWGKLWLPTEVEVYGYPVHATGSHEAKSGLNNELIGGLVQYPIFAGSAGYTSNRIKSRVYWWLASVAGGSVTHACRVNGDGLADAIDCTNAGFSAPVCFRVG